jgi:hypothetical protein
MSDVSGIPYMGPMGQGNFFAPQFSYNPQMTAGQIQSAYMPEVANNQNTLSQLYGAGANQGFGQQTANYAALGAAYGRAVPLSPGAMYMFSDTGQSAQAPAFNQGAINNFATGGGGFNFPSVPNYSGGIGGSYGLGEGLGSSGFNTTSLQNLFGNWNAPSQPSLDWSTLFSGGGGARADPYPGMAMPGGLNAPMSGSGLDWGGLFGGGAARADPYPGMAMPGGLGSPMVTPQQPPTDFGSLFGRGVGGTSGAPETPQPAAPSFDVPRSLAQPSLTDYGAPPTLPSFDWTKLFGGGGGGAATETTAPRSSSVFDTGAAPIIGTQDTGPLGGGAGIGGLDTGRAIGAPYTQAAEPQRGMLQEPVTEAYNPYFGVTSPYGERTGGEVVGPGGGLTAADMAEQARARLADLMSGVARENLPGEAGRGGMVGRPAATDTDAADLPLSAPRSGQQAPSQMQRNLDELAQEADKLQLPGEAGRGGMVGRPAEPAIDWTTGVPLPAARPAEAPAAESPATRAYPGADAPRPSQDVFPARRLAPNGQEPEAFIVHHTEGNPTLQSVVDYWKGGSGGRGQGFGTQYFMDRNAVIHDVRAETGYTGTSQTFPANQPGTEGLRNSNVVGMEISAKNDKDVTPAQLEALKAFTAARFPDTPAYGHKEIEGGKGEAEGFTGARAILQDRPPLFNFDWSKAPIPDPTMTVVDPITGRMGPNPNLGAGASAVPGPRAEAPDATSRAALASFVAAPGGAPEVNPQQGPTMPTWQATIPPAYRSPEVTAAIETQARRFGIPPEAILAVAGVEGSGWNPQSMTKSQAGIFQMAPGDFQTAGGRLGGLTYDEYRRATPAQQVAAYGDFIASSPNAAYLDYASGDPALTAAILQGIQFSPQSEAWTQRLLGGDTSSRVTPKPQANELLTTSIDDMRAAFARRIAGFPQTQFLPGGR